MTESTALQDSLKCMICLDFADQAVETACCHHIGCQKCLEPMQKCPTCQKESFEVQPAILLRRVIANLPAVCPNEECGATTTKGELEAHVQICQSPSPKLIHCPLGECDFRAEKQELAKHIADKHPERTLQYIVSGLEEEKVECFFSPCKTEVPQQEFWKHLQESHAKELGGKPFLFVKNRAGVKASLGTGTNGKFYCGRANVVYDSGYGCIEKRNKPCRSEINCSDCMELDLIFRDLKNSVPLKLINRDGRVCQTDACNHNVRGNVSSAAAMVPLICGQAGCDRDPEFYCKTYRYPKVCDKGPNGVICCYCEEIGKLQRKMYTDVWDQ